MDNISLFNASQFAESVAAAANISLEDVTILQILFEVVTTYSFGGDITESDAKTAVAQANNVSVDQVVVELTSSLESTQTRRLSSTQVKATIKTDDASKVDEIASSAANATALQESLASLGRTVAITLQTAPKTSVRVTTAVRARPGGTKVPPPTNQALTLQIKAVMGVDVVTSVEEIVITTTTFFVPSPVPSPSPSPTPTPSYNGVGIPRSAPPLDSHGVRAHQSFRPVLATVCGMATIFASLELR